MLNVLENEVRRAVERYCHDSVQREAMVRVLEWPGFALHPAAPCRAGTLTLQVYHAISGATSIAATQGAAGVELTMEAAYLFDEVADGEVDSSRGLMPSEELALAIAMQTCGAAAACEAAHHAKYNGFALGPLLLFYENCVAASAGQFLDAHLERRSTVTTDEALRMTVLKAGSLGRFAAEYGASLATDEPEIVRLCGDFGHGIFTYGQLIDDVIDACPDNYMEGDLARSKKTLPAVFFRNSPLQSGSRAGRESMQPASAEDGPHIRREFESSGAALFSTIIAEVFLNRAKSCLAELQGRGAEVRGLEELLDSLVVRSAKATAVS